MNMGTAITIATIDRRNMKTCSNGVKISRATPRMTHTPIITQRVRYWRLRCSLLGLLYSFLMSLMNVRGSSIRSPAYCAASVIIFQIIPFDLTLVYRKISASSAYCESKMLSAFCAAASSMCEWNRSVANLAARPPDWLLLRTSPSARVSRSSLAIANPS